MEMSLFLQIAFLILEIGTLLIICLPIVFLILKIRMIYHDSKVLEISMTNTEKWILQYIQRRPKIIPAFYRKLQAIKLRKSKYSRIFNIEYLEGLCLFFIYIHILSLFSVLVFLYMAKNIDFKIYEILVKRMIFVHTFVYFVFYFYVVNHDFKILEMSHSESIEVICHYYSYYTKKIIPAFYKKQLRLMRIQIFFSMMFICIDNFLNRYRYIPIRIVCVLKRYRYIPIRIAYILENFFRDKQYDRECPICFNICESKVTACGHCFCHSCLFNINMKNCPQCRQRIDVSQIIYLCDAPKAGRHVFT
jgi:hypothetical protein